MKITYICHPIKGDVPGNMEKIRQIVRHINLTERRVVPFAPYMVDLQVLDDNVPAERARGIYNDYEYFNRKMIDEVRVYGDVISEGMQAEIDLARRNDIPVIYFPYPPVIAERALRPPVPPPDRHIREGEIPKHPPRKLLSREDEKEFNSAIDRIGNAYEAAKDGIYRGEDGGALDCLRELRDVACVALRKAYKLDV